MATLTHDYHGTPREVSRPDVPIGVVGRLIRACCTDVADSTAGLKKWWHTSTDADFLNSKASRRDCWRILLPIPCLLALFSDTANAGPPTMVVFDAVATAVIAVAACLPQEMILSDVAIAIAHGVFICLRNGIADRAALCATWGQIMAIFTMGLAGIHSSAVAGFLLLVTLISSVFGLYTTDLELFGTSVFAVATVALLERRISLLVSIRNEYKALAVASTRCSDMYQEYSSRDHWYQAEAQGYRSPRGSWRDGQYSPQQQQQYQHQQQQQQQYQQQHHSTSSRVSPSPAGLLGPGDDVETGSTYTGESRGSLADYVLSRFRPGGEGGKGGSSLYEALKGTFSGQNASHTYEPSQVLKPGAADHDPPTFPELTAAERGARSWAEQQTNKSKAPATQLASLLHREEDEPDFPAPLPPPNEARPSPSGPSSNSQNNSNFNSGNAPAPSVTSQASATPLPPRDPPPQTVGPEFQRNSKNSQNSQISNGTAQHAAVGSDSLPAPLRAAQGMDKTYRGLKLCGFKNSVLNELFVENDDPDFAINGRETYWSPTGDFFLYHSAATNTWGLAKTKRFRQVKVGQSNGIAHSPEGFEIWQNDASLLAQSKKAWREWDPELDKWVARPGSGVESRGRMRRKRPDNATTEREVQTEHPALREQATQTVESRAGMATTSRDSFPSMPPHQQTHQQMVQMQQQAAPHAGSRSPPAPTGGALHSGLLQPPGPGLSPRTNHLHPHQHHSRPLSQPPSRPLQPASSNGSDRGGPGPWTPGLNGPNDPSGPNGPSPGAGVGLGPNYGPSRGPSSGPSRGQSPGQSPVPRPASALGPVV